MNDELRKYVQTLSYEELLIELKDFSKIASILIGYSNFDMENNVTSKCADMLESAICRIEIIANRLDKLFIDECCKSSGEE